MHRVAVVLALFFASTLAACGMPCEQDGDFTLCGEIGEPLYQIELDSWLDGVAWPPVIAEDGTVLLGQGNRVVTIEPGGLVETVATGAGTLSPVSMSSDGMLYAVDVTDSASLMAVDTTSGSQTGDSSGSFFGSESTSPPALGDDSVFFTTTDDDGTTNTFEVSSDDLSGDIARPRASSVTVLADGSLRYLQGAVDCWDTHTDLVAEDGNGNVLWRHTDMAGLIDFAPGAAGECYVVNGDRELFRIGANGNEAWSFAPDCKDCNVAAAPTITEEAVYFPVWEGWVPTNNCSTETILPPQNDAFDPLYALTPDGELLWVYDGFLTQQSPLGLPMFRQTVHHHPSGRPSIATDGTLFVATDGAVVTLDSNGNEIGRAIYDPWMGEGSGGIGFTWGATGMSPPPVLAPDGTLLVYDGWTIYAFDTGKTAAQVPWTAPFGGPTNDGNVR